jgi:ATP-dependent Clp protease ATP-binding subunit ClpC
VFERFTKHARRVVVLAQEDARRLNHAYIGTEHLLLGLTHDGVGLAAQVLASLGVTHEVVYRQVEELIGRGKEEPSGHIPFTPRVKTILELSLREAQQLGDDGIDTQHLLLGLISEGNGVAAKVLLKLKVDLKVLRARLIELTEPGVPLAEETAAPVRDQITQVTPLGRLRGLLTGGRGSTEPEPEPAAGSVARRAVARVYRNLEWDRPPGQSLTERARQGLLDPVTGREEQAGLLLEALCRRKRNNVLLIGESGVGKSALIHGLVHAIATNTAVPPRLSRAEVWQVEHTALWTARIRSGAGNQGGHVVLVVEDLDLLFGADAQGIGFAAASLYTLCQGDRPLIATITPSAYQTLEESRPLLAAKFLNIAIPAADAEETVAILTVLRGVYERYHGVTISDEAIAAAPALAAQRLPGRPLPGAAIDLIDAAGARLHVSGLGPDDRLIGEPKEDGAESEADAETGTEDEKGHQAEAEAAIVDVRLLNEIAREETGAPPRAA